MKNKDLKVTIILLIVVVILAVGIGVGGGYLISKSKMSSNDDSKNSTSKDTSGDDGEKDNTSKLNEEEMYQSIINDYKNAFSEANLDNYDEIASKYKMVNPSILLQVLRYEENNLQIGYAYYDIDKNGIKELIVGIGANSSFTEGAIYGYNPNTKNPEKIFYQDTLERGRLYIYNNGIIFSEGSGGAALHYYEFGKIAENGYSYEEIEDIEEEYTSANSAPTYRDWKAKKELNYKNLDEIKAKYLKDSVAIKITDFEKIDAKSQKNDNKNNANKEHDVAVSAIKSALKDANWLKENVSIKYDWGGTELTNLEEQRHNFMVLKNEGNSAPIVVVYTASSPEEYSGSYQLFMVSYENGKVISTPMTANSNHAGHCNMRVDANNKIAKYSYGHMNSGLDIYMKIYSNKVEELDKFEYEFYFDSNDTSKMIRENFKKNDKSVSEDEIKKIEAKYANCKFYDIKTELTSANIDEYVK